MNINKISIIIAAYNAESTLNKCITSIRQQTLKDIEILCIDDCSTDKTPHIMLRHSQFDKRVKFVTLDKNNKQGFARNYGIKIATGKYLCFLDSDDYLHDNQALEQLYKTINNNVDIVIFSYRKYYKKFHWYSKPIVYKQLNENKLYTTPADKNSILLSNSIGVPWNKIYRTDFLIKQNITFAEHILYEDIPFFFKSIILANNIKLLKKDLITYNKSSKSTMQIRNINNNHIIDNYAIVKDFLQQNNLYETYEYPFIYKSYGAFVTKFLIIPLSYKKVYLQKLQPFLSNINIEKYKTQLGKKFIKYKTLQNLHSNSNLSLLFLILLNKIRGRL